MARILDDWIDSYLKFVHMTEPPVLYKEWCAASTVAACLKRKCWLDWETQNFPNMYIVLIGSSGVRKGTAMFPALAFLKDVGVKMSAESLTREALIQILHNSIESYTPDTKDFTEQVFHSSLTIFSPELAVFLGYNQPTLISALTDWWDCRDPWVYHTKGGGEERIEATWVNLIGATTPDLLQTALPQDAIGGGLTSRMIFVYGHKKSKKVPLPFKYLNIPENIKLRSDLLKDLEVIAQMQGPFIPDEDYLRLYEDWYEDHEDIDLKNEPNFEPYLTRRSTHLRKLSMILSASRSDEMNLTKVDFLRALLMLERTEEEMPHVFSGYGKSPFADLYRRIVIFLKTNGGNCSFGEILGHFHRDISEEDLNKTLRAMEIVEPQVVKLRIKTFVIDGNKVGKRWVDLVL